MNPPSDDVVSLRLASLEKSIEACRAEMASVRVHVDERLDRVQGSIAGLQFVRQDVYGVEMRGRREYEEETRRIAESAKKSSETAAGNLKWAVGIIVLVVLATLGAFTWVAV